MQQKITDINGIEVTSGDVIRFTENFTDLSIFDNWIARVYMHKDYGPVTRSPLDPENGIRILSNCKFEIIWPRRHLYKKRKS
jgi:hypothetical protein